ncbi:flagellar protein FlhE [Sphaerotilus natans]|jgi:flagellar protein FlhE|uniref:flagellar protein FlhE n=1 Tax=Sphaerotilus natans TaxID=34103 RepID=UPI0009DFF2E4|nr:flagellar protein FlhE [Sphaerotilus natans]
MAINKRVFSFCLITVAVAFSAIGKNAIAASGGYSSSVVAPTIYAKNLWYNVPFPVVGTPVSGTYVGLVYYSWNYKTPRPTGFLVYLCNNTGLVCFDVTNYASGFVDFTGQNVPANQTLRLYSRVNGTGTMSSLYGGSSSVNVNWSN